MAAKSKAFSNGVHGVAFYSIVADKLAGNGQVESAIDLLELSLVQYEGKPGRRQLLDQLIALRQPPPADGYAFATKNRKRRGRGMAAGYRGKVWRPSSLDPDVFQKEWDEKVERDRALHNSRQ